MKINRTEIASIFIGLAAFSTSFASDAQTTTALYSNSVKPVYGTQTGKCLAAAYNGTTGVRSLRFEVCDIQNARQGWYHEFKSTYSGMMLRNRYYSGWCIQFTGTGTSRTLYPANCNDANSAQYFLRNKEDADSSLAGLQVFLWDIGQDWAVTKEGNVVDWYKFFDQLVWQREIWTIQSRGSGG